MKSKDYWKTRFEAVEDMMNKRGKRAVQEIVPSFDRALAEIEDDLNSWYQRFADNNGVSLVDAKKLLNKKELKEFKWTLEEYIEYGKKHNLNPEWMKQVENASAKFHISRLEALKIHTQQAAEKAFGNETDVLDKLISKVYTEDYYHTAFEIQKGVGIAWDIGTVDERRLSKLLEKPWTADGKTFSDRIWASKSQLIESVNKELTQMCILGKSPKDAIDNISRSMSASKSQAGRLVMTESAYFASQAQKDCFKDLDVEEYEILATLDSKTSDICREMDGRVFKMSEFEVGVTAPPFHPWCRTTTIPYFDDEWGREGTRAARGEDGKTYQVPADMTYGDWKEKYSSEPPSGDESSKYLRGMKKIGVEKANGVFINRKEDLAGYAKNIRPEDGFSDFTCHADADNFYLDMGGNGNDDDFIIFPVEEFAKHIKDSKEYKNAPIRLISCSAGAKENGAAQKLADILKVDVKAATETVNVAENGDILITNNDILAEMWYNDEDNRDKYINTGYWKVFHPRKG